MKSLIKFLLFSVALITPIWLIQTASSEPIDSGPNDIFLPLISNPAILLKNGNFEAGRTEWKQYSSNYWWLIVHKDDLPIKPRGGVWAAWLGGDYNEDSILWQEVAIPLNNPTLTYWLWIGSNDYCGYDIAGVTINTDVAVDAFWLCTDTNTGGWSKRTINLGAFAGNTVSLEFAAFNDETLISSLYLDDIVLGDVAYDTAQIDQAIYPQAALSGVKPAELISTGDKESVTAGPTLQKLLITYLKTAGR